MIADPTAQPQSLIVLLGSDAATAGAVGDWLEPLGWTCASAATPDSLPDILADALAGDAGRVPALFLLDGRGVGEKAGAAWVAAARALPGIAAGTPMILLDEPGSADLPGLAGRIDLPLGPAAARAVLEHWAGPLADHGFRDGGSAHYRLVRLAGRAQADALVRGFADQLEEAIACAEEGESLRAVAHRIAGLAGLVGYGELTAVWSAVDRTDSGDRQTAVDASRAVIERIKAGFPKD